MKNDTIAEVIALLNTANYDTDTLNQKRDEVVSTLKKQLSIQRVGDSCLYDEKKLFESYKAGYCKLLDERIIFTEDEIIKELKPDFDYWLKTGQL